MKRIRDRGPLLLVAAALLWSFSGLFVKSVSWDSLSISAVRGMVAFVLISAVRRPFPIRLNRIKVLTSACYVAQGVLFIAAHSRTTAASATALQYTSPLYIIFFAFLAERKLPKFRDVISCLALLSGIVLSCLGGLRGGGLTGNLLAMASAVFYAGVFYGSRLPAATAWIRWCWERPSTSCCCPGCSAAARFAPRPSRTSFWCCSSAFPAVLPGSPSAWGFARRRR